MKLRHRPLTRVFQVMGGNLHVSGDNKIEFEGDAINDSESRDSNGR
jgi:hypothetical protein